MGSDTANLAKAVFNFDESEFFDRPSAMRLLSGVMRTANDYSMQFANSIYMDLKDNNINVLLDCNLEAV